MVSTALEYSVGFQGGVYVDSKFWFPSLVGNALLCCDDKGKVEYVGKFLNEREDSDMALYGEVLSYRDKLIFTPLRTQSIAVYDLTCKKFESIYIKKKSDAVEGMFLAAVIWNDYLYLFPFYYRGILKVNLNNWDIEVIDSWIAHVDKFIISSEAPYFRSDFVQKDSFIYIAFCNAPAVLEFDLSTDKFKIYNVGNTGYSSIAFDGTNFWLAPRTMGNLVCWNLKKKKISYYGNFPAGYCHGGAVGSFCFDKYWWIFPERGNSVLKVNVHTGEIKIDILFSDICMKPYSEYSIWNSSFVYCKKMNDGVLLCSGKSSEVIYFNPTKNILKKCVLQVPAIIKADYDVMVQEKRERFIALEKEKSICHESAMYSLREFLCEGLRA